MIQSFNRRLNCRALCFQLAAHGTPLRVASRPVDGFVALLKEDATMSMPPWRQWYLGRKAIRSFFVWALRSEGHGPFRLVPTAANGQPAFAVYARRQSPEWRAHAIQLLRLEGESIAAVTNFVAPPLFTAFGFPAILPADGDAAPQGPRP